MGRSHMYPFFPHTLSANVPGPLDGGGARALGLLIASSWCVYRVPLSSELPGRRQLEPEAQSDSGLVPSARQHVMSGFTLFRRYPLSWGSLCLSQNTCSSSNPGTCDCGLIWKEGLYRCHQVKMRSSWIKVGSCPVTGVLKRRGNLDTDAQKGERLVKTQMPTHRGEGHVATEAETRAMRL